MPLTDTPDGQTHYQNDGCGEKEHNDGERAIYTPRVLIEAILVNNGIKGWEEGDQFMQEVENALRAIERDAEERGRQQGIREAREKIESLKKYPPKCVCDGTINDADCEYSMNLACSKIIQKLDSLLSQQEEKKI